ncbi:ATP-binding cassette domain-containing protein [Neoroseomonas lacus]|uniref:ATPase AAA-type core domain-containing protein n=1 Tax=Neoroseomonas lacus TaxID=287609 RepID=A0A917NZS3_9PROT|nr:hypothetical protein [Neoroseomonas lacus]GGJ44627.1 hypothetical protein GCM10011320_60100 [Neoroseomonas lacus]
MALVGSPAILFLVEPTTGLDLASVHAIRDVVVRMKRDRCTTMLLTTHKIEEAGDLCHRVAIIDQGRMTALDTPQALRGTIESRRSIEVRFATSGVAPGDVLADASTIKVTPLPMTSAPMPRMPAGWRRTSPHTPRQ